MNCSIVRNHLSAFMDGELSPDLAFEVDQHVAGCEACASELAAFQQIGELARGQDQLLSPPLSWDGLAQRLNHVSPPLAGPAVSDELSASCGEKSQTNPVHALSSADELAAPVVNGYGSAHRRSVFHWMLMSGGLGALAASWLVLVNLWLPSEQNGSATGVPPVVATMNLQPVLELFRNDAQLALSQLTNQFSTEEVDTEQADAGLGRPTYVNAAASQDALPGHAKIALTKILSFPFCQCAAGQCSCGPGGCNCVACICERPDGSTYLVLEHCKSQTVSFGDLPVKLATRNGQAVQHITVDGTQTISFDRSTGKVTVVGLRSEAEIETLLASN